MARDALRSGSSSRSASSLMPFARIAVTQGNRDLRSASVKAKSVGEGSLPAALASRRYSARFLFNC